MIFLCLMKPWAFRLTEGGKAPRAQSAQSHPEGGDKAGVPYSNHLENFRPHHLHLPLPIWLSIPWPGFLPSSRNLYLSNAGPGGG